MRNSSSEADTFCLCLCPFYEFLGADEKKLISLIQLTNDNGAGSDAFL